MLSIDSYSLPSSVGRYLLPQEQVILTVRQHPACMLAPLAAALGGLLASVVVTVIPDHGSVPLLAAWLLSGLLILRAIFLAQSWLIRFMTLTSTRFLLTSGVTTRRVKFVPFSSLVDMTFTRSFSGRLLGYGTFTVEAGGKPQIIVDFVPYSEQLLLVLGGTLYPGPSEDSDDDDTAEPVWPSDNDGEP